MKTPTLLSGKNSMQTFGRQLRRGVVLTAICLMTLSNSGCTLTGGFIGVMWEHMLFWKTLPVVPVPARASQLMEDKLHEDERYNKVPVLDPVEGDVFCVDPPSEDQVIRALPDDGAGGFAFFQETQLNNVRIVVEPLVDRLDECKVYPLVGPCRRGQLQQRFLVFFTRITLHWV